LTNLFHLQLPFADIIGNLEVRRPFPVRESLVHLRSIGDGSTEVALIAATRFVEAGEMNKWTDEQRPPL